MNNDWFLHQILKIGPWGLFLLCIGCFFIGVLVMLIVMAEKAGTKYTYYASQPWRQRLIIGDLGSNPVYGMMYSEGFVRFLWRRLKGSRAKIEAMRRIGKL